ncbi:hypothetical protein EK904_011060 [Melospiza melodia maxima]|nr:hypothetical protein EK904_011060 [Melospiza melodia maxima]
MSLGNVGVCHGRERRQTWEGSQDLCVNQRLQRAAQEKPQITSPPYDTWNITGQDVIFGCEVFAYPMASIEWRKDGTEMLLPGDDPHISVQVRGVPRALKTTPE